MQEGKAMRISRRVVTGIVTGFLVSASYAPVFATAHDAQNAQGVTSDVTIPCEPLSWDAANRLPWFIKASTVECMSPTQDDLQASAQARSLLAKAAAEMQTDRATSGSSAVTEYNDGVAAYAEGRYIEAIDHFQAAVPSAKP
jgi:TolA-binding protein